MFHLIARVRNQGNPKIFKLISDEEIFNLNIDTLELVEYSAITLLDEGAWFEISDFLNQPYCIDLLKKPFISAEYNVLPADKYNKISYLCSFQNDNFYFQKVTPSTYIKNKRILRFGDAVTIEEDADRLFISDIPDAVYLAENDKLIFRNLATISSMFKGVDTLYKEATHEQVEEFLESDFIKLTNDYTAGKVNKPNRKRIALAIDTLAEMNDKDQGVIFDYIVEYCEDMVFDSNKKSFEIESDSSLKNLLFGIEQRFFTTPVGEEKRVANSIQKI
jgi:hypothetical protein